MGKAKKIRSTSHKKQVPPTGGLTMMEMEDINSEDYSSLMADEAEMFKGVSAVVHGALYGYTTAHTADLTCTARGAGGIDPRGHVRDAGHHVRRGG